jgi:hypothetical protein
MERLTQYCKINPAPEVQNEYIIPKKMLLRVMILRGTRPASFFWICMNMKTPNSTPKRISSTMICAFFQAYIVPPHCKAINKHTIDARKIANEGRSNFDMFSLQCDFLGGFR